MVVFLRLWQSSDVWVLWRSEPTYLWKHYFELFFHKILLKMYLFNWFVTNSLRKVFCEAKFWFLLNLFSISPVKLGFWTNLESIAVICGPCSQKLYLINVMFFSSSTFCRTLLHLVEKRKKEKMVFGHKSGEPICFQKKSWKISSNWCFQRNVCSNLKRAQAFKHCFM